MRFLAFRMYNLAVCLLLIPLKFSLTVGLDTLLPSKNFTTILNTSSLTNTSLSSLASSVNTSSLNLLTSLVNVTDSTKVVSLLNTTSQSLTNLTTLLNTTDIASLTSLLNTTANSSNLASLLNVTDPAKLAALLNTTSSSLLNLTAMLNSTNLPPLNLLLNTTTLSSLNLNLLNGTDLVKLASLLNNTLNYLNSSGSLSTLFNSTSLNNMTTSLAALINSTGFSLTDVSYSNNGVTCNCSVNSAIVAEKSDVLRKIILPSKIKALIDAHSGFLVLKYGATYNWTQAIITKYPAGSDFGALSYNGTLNLTDWTAMMAKLANITLPAQDLAFINQTISSAIRLIHDLNCNLTNHFGITMGMYNPWLTMRYPGSVTSPPRTYPWGYICNCTAGFMAFMDATPLSTVSIEGLSTQMSSSLAKSTWNSSFTNLEYNGNSGMKFAVYFQNYSANLANFYGSYAITNLTSMQLSLNCYKEFNVSDVQAVLKDIGITNNCFTTTASTSTLSPLPSTSIPTPSLNISLAGGANTSSYLASGSTSTLSGLPPGSNTSSSKVTNASSTQLSNTSPTITSKPSIAPEKHDIPSAPTPIPFTTFMMTITIPAVVVLILLTTVCMCCLQADCGKKKETVAVP